MFQREEARIVRLANSRLQPAQVATLALVHSKYRRFRVVGYWGGGSKVEERAVWAMTWAEVLKWACGMKDDSPFDRAEVTPTRPLTMRDKDIVLWNKERGD
jgi:hypothetical protein